MKAFLKVATLLSLFITILISCNNTSTEPIPIDENIKLTEVDAAVIEAYLNIHIESPSPDKEVVLERNGQIVMRFSANKADAAITDTGLTENTLYRYKAKLTEKGKIIGESSEVSVRTMQPTSHDFTWQTFTFGEHSSSSLYDVAIIDENNIWAVGEIYMKDSTGQIDPQFYNLVKWDGNKWNTQRIFFTNQQGQSFLAPIKSIFVFNSDDIWLGMDQMIHWDGNDFKEYEISSTVFQSWINKIWGTSSSDLYIVGNNGNIAHYNSSNWQKIENNVSNELDFFDLFGRDETSPIYFIAASLYGNNRIIRLINSKFEDVPFNEISTLRSIWYAYSNKIYLAGSYFFVYENGKWEKLKELSNQTTTSVRGTASNDIIVAGTKGIINHFNGITWQSYPTQGEYSAVGIKGNRVVAVGSSSVGEAFITIGKRN
ncbi:MAG: glucosyl transferase [Melioribacteraceae bacterium]